MRRRAGRRIGYGSNRVKQRAKGESFKLLKIVPSISVRSANKLPNSSRHEAAFSFAMYMCAVKIIHVWPRIFRRLSCNSEITKRCLAVAFGRRGKEASKTGGRAIYISAANRSNVWMQIFLFHYLAGCAISYW